MAAVALAPRTTAPPSHAPNRMPEVSAKGWVGSSGTISEAMRMASHNGTVSIRGRVSRVSSAPRRRSTSAPESSDDAVVATREDASEAVDSAAARAASGDSAQAPATRVAVTKARRAP